MLQTFEKYANCSSPRFVPLSLSGTQTVVAQYGSRGVGVNEYPHDGDALLALLNCKALKVLVKLSNTRGEGLAVMAVWVEQLFFKHALPLAQCSSRFVKLH